MKQLFRGEKAVPDHLRCRRSDGRRWRCPRRAIGRFKLCEHHQLQLRRNQEKQMTAAASARLKMKVHRAAILRPPEPQPDRRPRKRRRRREVVSPSPMEELIGMALQRQMERREEREKSRRREAKVTRDLPNGVMAISSVGPKRGFDNADPPVDRKLGFGAGCFLRRCFRSKNAEPLQVGSLQKFVLYGGGLESGMMICHNFGKSNVGVRAAGSPSQAA